MGIPRSPHPEKPPVVVDLPYIAGPTLPPPPPPTVTNPTPSIPAPPTSSAKATKVGAFRVVTSNVKNLAAHEGTINDTFQQVNSRSKASLFLWQEVSPGGDQVVNYRDNLLAALPGLSHAFALPGNQWYDAPISFNAGVFTQANLGSTKFFKGVSGVSGARFITNLLLTLRGTGHPIAAKSLHTIPHAYSGSASEQKQRRPWYNAGITDFVNTIAADVKVNHPVIAGGDMNRQANSLPSTIAGYRVQAIDGGIDWLYFVDCKSYYWKLTGEKQTIAASTLHSDHPAIAHGVELWYRP